MRPFAKMFRIDGKPMFAPDADVAVSYSDLDSDDSGRDASGLMHRVVVRYRMGGWSVRYSYLTEEEKRYMERLFPETPYFTFTHPDRVAADKEVTTRAYRSEYGIVWHSARTGQWRDLKFDIIEC